jgi:hypothetical protein
VLQGAWSGLDKFQKTRGVLKMMAQIVYRLWRDQSPHPMIMPGDVPLTDDKVRTNALDPIIKGYDSVVSKEIAGDQSKPAQIEARSSNVGKSKAVTRAATAVFMATSPFGSTNKGVDVSRVRLACAIPGEQPSQFSEALRRLSDDNAAYLYNQGESYWFSPIASLNEEAEQRAKGLVGSPKVEAEINDLLRAEERLKGAGFLRVHGAPDDPLGIDDAYEAALVILPPSAWHRGREQDTPAMKLAADIIEHKGAGQRRNRNRLAFLAVDQAAWVDIETVVRKKLAWESIVADSRSLQLPRAQEDEAKKRAEEQEAAAVSAVRRGWKHLLLPQEPQPGSQHAARGFDLEPTSLTNRSVNPEPLPQAAWKKCEQDGLIVSTLGVLDNDLEKVWQPPDQPHLSVRQLRDWFAQFPYLSKLREPSVLARALSAAIAHSDAKYALADGFDASKGEYTGLKLRQLVEVKLDSDALIVRRSVAEVQIQKGETAAHSPRGVGPQPSSSGQSGEVPAPTNGAVAPRPRRFYAKVVLDPSRPTPMVSQIAQSILSELDRVRGTTITITLDIDAETPAGFPQDVEDVVRDNAKTLKIVEFDFAKE